MLEEYFQDKFRACDGNRPTEKMTNCENSVLAELKTQRLESVVNVQTLNLLRRCMSGDSLASVFYWTIIPTRRYGGKNTDGPIAHNTTTIWTDIN